MIRRTHSLHRSAARMEPLEDRRLFALVAAPVTAPSTSSTPGCGCGDPNTIVVDDDRRQCPNADFQSIQLAVLAAPPGSTIKVCPGVYREEVNVPKTLRLLGAGANRDCRSGCGDTQDPNRDSIIEPPLAPTPDMATGLVRLLFNDIEFDGFVVRKNTAGPGIYTSSLFSGYEVEDNLVTRNVFGLYFHSSGTYESVARENCFVDNNVAGAAAGNGIYSDQGLRNADITSNYFTKHTNAAVVLAGAPGTQTDVNITCNTAVNDSSFALFNVDHGALSRNFSYNSAGSGYFLGGGNNRIDLTCNVAIRATFSGIATNDPFADPPSVPLAPSTNILISKNLLMDNGEAGISMRHIINSRAESNYAVRNGRLEPGDGIRLGEGAENNSVTCNVADRNGRDGIRAEVGSANNTIAHNRMRSNREHDAHDDTTGPYNPPALVANQWYDNDCRTQNRPGLCDHCGCGCGDGHDSYDKNLSDEEKAEITGHEALAGQDTSLVSLDPGEDVLVGKVLSLFGGKEYR